MGPHPEEAGQGESAGIVGEGAEAACLSQQGTLVITLPARVWHEIVKIDMK